MQRNENLASEIADINGKACLNAVECCKMGSMTFKG